MTKTVREVLPQNFKPLHYDLHIYDIDSKADTFEGKVTIDLDVVTDSDEIVINADGLTFNETKITCLTTKTESTVHVESVNYNEKAQSATIKLKEHLKADLVSKVQLFVQYSAKIRNNMAGFYRSDYQDIKGQDQTLLSTQFEATDARTALPCFDEPNLKASFQVTVTCAEELTVLSNTPVVTSKSVNDGKKGGNLTDMNMKTVQFMKTPLMSTYLLAWVIGKLDYIESFTQKSYNCQKIPVRVYTAEGISEQGQFGLEVATKVVDLFSEIFEIDYVLPKLDLVSVPAYSHNAMENWGLITFRPTALLYDKKASDSSYKVKVAYVVAHELAHQWFGNLVTMDWWDELWLNEGFATWVGNVALMHLFPEWRIFDLDSTKELQNALKMDSLRSSHPVEVPIQSSSDIDQVFDAISYLKGGAVINQIANSIGIEVFLKGVSAYLKKNKFANGTTNDLLQSITEVSGVDIVQKGHVWIRMIGFPYVKVSRDGDNIKFTQSRFLSSGDASADEDQTTWWVPLNISTGPSEDDKVADLELFSKTAVAKDLSGKFFKVNKNAYGFYRTIYDEKSLDVIKGNLDKLTAKDKVNLITDASATAMAGLSSTTVFLDLVKTYQNETDYIVWLAVLETWNAFKSAWFEASALSSEAQDALSKLFKQVIEPTVSRFDFTVDPSEEFLATRFRADMLKAGVDARIPSVTSKARELFEKKEPIDPSLKKVVYQAVVSGDDATEEDFQKIYDIAQTSDALDAREVVLGALGTVTAPKLIEKALSLMLSEEVPIMDLQFVAYPLAKNSRARPAFLEYFKENYDAIYNRVNANPVTFDRLVKFTFNAYASDEAHSTIKTIFAGKNLYGFERSLDQSLESVKTNAAWIKRDKKEVEGWLKVHNLL